MKHLALLLMALGCGSGTGLDTSDGLRVLFIGNSLTYTNNIPGMLKALIDSANAGPVTVEQVTFGGYGLEDHWGLGSAQDAIAEGGWDVVVIQQGPSATEGRPSLLEYSQRYADEAARVGARLALYMVWPAIERSFDFDGVSESYTMAAQQVDGMLFPVGEAWRAAWRRDPDLALYGSDGFHPSVQGSYLAALVMFEQLTGRSPLGLPGSMDVRSSGFPLIPVQIPSATAELLQAAAIEANDRFGLR
jgi:hypothetical protein